MVKKDIPERRWFLSRRMLWASGKWPTKWGFLINDWGFGFHFGEPKIKFHNSDLPEPQFSFRFDLKPFSMIAFWGQKRLFWIGDWAWKKSLSD